MSSQARCPSENIHKSQATADCLGAYTAGVDLTCHFPSFLELLNREEGQILHFFDWKTPENAKKMTNVMHAAGQEQRWFVIEGQRAAVVADVVRRAAELAEAADGGGG